MYYNLKHSLSLVILSRRCLYTTSLHPPYIFISSISYMIGLITHIDIYGACPSIPSSLCSIKSM